MALTTPAQKPLGLSRKIFFSEPLLRAKRFRGIEIVGYDYSRGRHAPVHASRNRGLVRFADDSRRIGTALNRVRYVQRAQRSIESHLSASARSGAAVARLPG